MELNEQLAEWAGWYDITSGGTFLTGKHEHWSNHRAVIPNFTNSLDACFEWLVPKLGKVKLQSNEAPSGDVFWNAEVKYYGQIGKVTHENPALALCKAIEKVIDG